MTFERCLESKNATLMELLSLGYNETNLPPVGSVISTTGEHGLVTKLMPALPVCDLEKELGNVSYWF